MLFLSAGKTRIDTCVDQLTWDHGHSFKHSLCAVPVCREDTYRYTRGPAYVGTVGIHSSIRCCCVMFLYAGKTRIDTCVDQLTWGPWAFIQALVVVCCSTSTLSEAVDGINYRMSSVVGVPVRTEKNEPLSSLGITPRPQPPVESGRRVCSVT